jgi:hypothetical protein
MSKIQAIDVSMNLMRSILWQYEPASRAVALAEHDQSFVDAKHSGFWQDWYRDVFDISTANDFGLYLWGLILDCPMRLAAGQKTGYWWGFGPHHANFGQGNFGGIVKDFVDLLTTDEARQVILLRWAQMTVHPTITNTGAILDRIFGPGHVYLIDNFDMTQAYYFETLPSRRMRIFLEKYDLLPRPAGVRSQILEA